MRSDMVIQLIKCDRQTNSLSALRRYFEAKCGECGHFIFELTHIDGYNAYKTNSCQKAISQMMKLVDKSKYG